MKTSRALLFALLTVFLYNATYATRMNQRDSKQIEMGPNELQDRQFVGDSFIQMNTLASSEVGVSNQIETTTETLKSEEQMSFEMSNSVTAEDISVTQGSPHDEKIDARSRALLVILFCILTLLAFGYFLHFLLSAAKEARKALACQEKPNQNNPLMPDEAKLKADF